MRLEACIETDFFCAWSCLCVKPSISLSRKYYLDLALVSTLNLRSRKSSKDCTLFHRRTRTDYVYNGCLAWYNVVLTPRSHSNVKYSQWRKVLTSVTSANNQHAHYTHGKNRTATTNTHPN